MAEQLTITINSPSDVIWQGKALAISSKNHKGTFDILPQHANFITIIKNHPITIHLGAGTKEFTFPQCVLYNHDNYVSIFTV
jgi:F0F1-type ATP synthase epsilon subunit